MNDSQNVNQDGTDKDSNVDNRLDNLEDKLSLILDLIQENKISEATDIAQEERGEVSSIGQEVRGETSAVEAPQDLPPAPPAPATLAPPTPPVPPAPAAPQGQPAIPAPAAVPAPAAPQGQPYSLITPSPTPSAHGHPVDYGGRQEQIGERSGVLSLSLPSLEAVLRWVGLALVVASFTFAVRALISKGYIGPKGQAILVTVAGFAFLAGGFHLRNKRRTWALSLAGIGAAGLYYLARSDLLASTFSAIAGVFLTLVVFAVTAFLAKETKSSGLTAINTVLASVICTNIFVSASMAIADKGYDLDTGERLVEQDRIAVALTLGALIAVIAASYFQTRFYRQSELYSVTNFTAVIIPWLILSTESDLRTPVTIGLGIIALAGAAIFARAHTPDKLKARPVTPRADGIGSDGTFMSEEQRSKVWAEYKKDTAAHSRNNRRRTLVFASLIAILPSFAFVTGKSLEQGRIANALVALAWAVAGVVATYWVIKNAKVLNAWALGLGAYLAFVVAIARFVVDSNGVYAVIALQGPVLLLIAWWAKNRQVLVYFSWIFIGLLWLITVTTFYYDADLELTLANGIAHSVRTLALILFGYIAWVEQNRHTRLPFPEAFKDRLGTGLYPGADPAANTKLDRLDNDSLAQEIAENHLAVQQLGHDGHTAQTSRPRRFGVWIVTALTVLLLVWIRRMCVPFEHGDMLISILWALLAFAWFAVGVRTRERGPATLGLGILVLTVVKLVLFDLTFLEPLARALVFAVVGLGMLRMAFILPKLEFEKALTTPDAGEDKESEKAHFQRLDTAIPEEEIVDDSVDDSAASQSDSPIGNIEAFGAAEHTGNTTFGGGKVQWPTAPPEQDT